MWNIYRQIWIIITIAVFLSWCSHISPVNNEVIQSIEYIQLKEDLSLQNIEIFEWSRDYSYDLWDDIYTQLIQDREGTIQQKLIYTDEKLLIILDMIQKYEQYRNIQNILNGVGYNLAWDIQNYESQLNIYNSKNSTN